MLRVTLKTPESSITQSSITGLLHRGIHSLPIRRLATFARRRAPLMLMTAAAATAAIAAPADVRVAQSDRRVEITGGAGAAAWRLVYGSRPNTSALLAPEGGDRAWFSHGGWLRRIDTRGGVVTDRWRFPNTIRNITAAGGKLAIEVREEFGRETFAKRVTFDPAQPVVPYWPENSLLSYLLPVCEARFSEALPAGCSPVLLRLAKEAAAPAARELEEMARRDPLTPWLRFTLAQVLRELGDPRAAAVLQEAVRLPGAHFSELLPMCALLDAMHERDLAGEAFERAYASFLESGSDPRLFYVLIGRNVLYRRIEPWEKMPPGMRAAIIERLYRLAPNAEAAKVSWQLYADQLQRQGQTREAALWRQRAAESEGVFFTAIPLPLDVPVLLLAASGLAAVFYIAAQWMRRWQWSWPERAALLTTFAAAWYAVGLGALLVAGVTRLATSPIATGMGSLAGPTTQRYLRQLPAQPERDLLLAVSLHQEGNAAEAESLYRRLPRFAEAWNNLGVLLRNARREEEARRAFQRALELRAGLPEAVLNLEGRATSLWTELHLKHLGGRPMLAPPGGSQFERAVYGGSWPVLYARALAGPFSVAGDLFRSAGEPQLGAAAVVALTILAGAILAVLRRRPSAGEQPRRKRQWLWEAAFPGTSSAWHAAGGLVLVAWCFLLLQIVLWLWKGTPWVIHTAFSPNFALAYGIEASDADLRRLLQPGWLALVLPAIGVFLANLALVAGWHRRSAAISPSPE